MRPRRQLEYEENFVECLEMLWGEGFLSPGGALEVRTILNDEKLSNRTVLDIGCGTGGAELLLATEYQVDRVVGIDIVPLLIERAQRLCERTELGDRILFKLVELGPLPFLPATFDVVFTKDTLLHMPDKLAALRDIHRVLRPGGLLLGSDWLAGENIAECPFWARFIELRRPSFVMVPPEAMMAAMREAGFTDISMSDRRAWLADLALHDLQAVEGPLRERLSQMLGEGYEDWVAVRRAIAGSARSGSLRPMHLKAVKAGVET
jgi:phosphoethanolamine N-methyltransferase